MTLQMQDFFFYFTGVTLTLNKTWLSPSFFFFFVGSFKKKKKFKQKDFQKGGTAWNRFPYHLPSSHRRASWKLQQPMNSLGVAFSDWSAFLSSFLSEKKQKKYLLDFLTGAYGPPVANLCHVLWNVSAKSKNGDSGCLTVGLWHHYRCCISTSEFCSCSCIMFFCKLTSLAL